MDPFLFTVPAFLVAFVLLWATVSFVGHPKDHGGVGWFQWRRVLKNGDPATATIAAQRDIRTISGGSRVRYTITTIEYLLDVTHGDKTFRASVTLPLRSYERSDIAHVKPLPVRVGEGIVVIDQAAVKAAAREKETAQKASKDAEFEKLRNAPPK